jgi:putative membrane protein
VATLLVHLVVTALLLLAVARFVKGVEIDGFGTALLAALVFGLVNGCVRPLMILLTLPLTVLTFGLFLFVVNALMFRLAAALVPGFTVRGFGPALLGSLLLSLLNLGVAALVGPR